VSLPNYRFSIMLQKANEMVAEVRNLGVELLSALEKRDAEALSTLRSGQELRLLQAVRDVRVNQIAEATVNIAALEKSKEIAQARKDYYKSREFISLLEGAAFGLLYKPKPAVLAKDAAAATAATAHLIPDSKLGAVTTI